MTGRISRTGRFALGACVALLVCAAPAAAGLPAGATEAPPTGQGTGKIRAGAAAVDATWHVGASAGQYASDGTFAGDHGLDPSVHSVRRSPSYGVQSRLSVRAIVVEGPDGTRTAIVKNDLYIPQDLLFRRTALLLEQGDSGIGRANLTMAVSHNHSSPYYSSPSWGVWAFQDVFDVRFYEYMARRQAEAVEKAAAGLAPARVGAAQTEFDKTHRHSYGPAIADDGTPAGYPVSDADHDMTLVRFDDVSDPENPKPIANLVNYALHPEFLEGNDLVSADYIGPFERMVDRASGAVTVFTQGAVGTAEPERSTYHSIKERLEFTHKDYAQAEYGARLMADAALGLHREIAQGNPVVGFFTDGRVQAVDAWYPGPFSHPYPGVSNCRTDAVLRGQPGVPLAGLPDCQRVNAFPTFGIDPGITTDDLQQAGIPLPENYSAPSYTGLQEDVNVHLQAVRIGDILLAICSCELWKDQSENTETRTDKVEGNEYVGYDWKARCTENGDGTYGDGPLGYGTGTWKCPDPRGGTINSLSDELVQRMHAQVTNPANGWNDLENVAEAESEAVDVREIKGNFTQDDDARSAELGYALTIPIGMANDYNGYIASYREYSRGDHYRKALTGFGPHSSDYMSTRLVTLARLMKDPGHELPRDQAQEQLLHGKVLADLAKNDGEARALGEMGGRLAEAWAASLPDDAPARPLTQPASIERFSAAFFTWAGGSNFTDDPVVRVERRVGSDWEEFADQTGEVPVTLRFPQGEDVASYRTGTHEWRWTAHFEAFSGAFDTGERPLSTPAGTYRFAVSGERRSGGEVVPYELVSEEFEVSPWSGITVEDLRLDGDGRASFKPGPRRTVALGANAGGPGPALSAEIGPIDYPDSYSSPIRFIQNKRTPYRDPSAPADASKIEWFCFTCTFRPWLDAGSLESVTFTVRLVGGGTEAVAGEQAGGRWRTSRPLAAGESAFVAAGDARDAAGNRNGADSAEVAANP